MFYYRPENKFPAYFFGGFCKEVNNPKIISLDLFAFITCDLALREREVPEGWKLENFIEEDIEISNNFYGNQSGGLLLNAMGIGRYVYEEETIESVYRRIDLMRSCDVYSLKDAGTLKAVIIVDQSNMGINMSELLNCIKVIVVDPALSWHILYETIRRLGNVYGNVKIRVMVYPAEYLVSEEVAIEKHYNLWILDTDYGDEYNNYIKQRANPRLPALPLNYN